MPRRVLALLARCPEAERVPNAMEVGWKEIGGWGGGTLVGREFQGKGQLSAAYFFFTLLGALMVL